MSQSNRSYKHGERCSASGQNVPVWPGWASVGADKKVACWQCGRRIAVSVRGTIETHNLPADFDPSHVTAGCPDCGQLIPLNWVVRHERTHDAERRLMADLRGKNK